MKPETSRRSGIALIIALLFLVLLSTLVIAFFMSVSNEAKAARNFSAGFTVRQLADSAVQTVIGQIADATSRPSGAWASQPGMIRVYRDNDVTPSANANAFYKLYSSDNMVVTQSQLAGFNPSTDFSGTWSVNPAFWTDLNAPVLVSDPANPTGPPLARYPIVDPGAKGLVEGFDYDVTNAGATASSPLPMPVKWIYVLQDGTLTAPDSGNGVTAKFTNPATQPTKANPIIGRIAFWTDDETSKLNVNTAAGSIDSNPPNGYDQNSYAGSYWDVPRLYSAFDFGKPDTTALPQACGGGSLGLCQLMPNEFQRYPGHPATTSLAPVFGSLFTSEQLYAVLPRYTSLNVAGAPGSSIGGTTRVALGLGNSNPTPDALQLQLKQDRFYASVDEMLFAAHATMAPTDPNYVRQTNDAALGLSNALAPALLDKLRFFVTTQSRAPELNLFGQPRVAIWPVRSQTTAEGSSGTTNGLNGFDKAMLYCASLGPADPTVPPDTTLTPPSGPYRYLFTRRELPATTGKDTFATPPPQDIAQPRNKQLLSYLQKLTSSPIPGFGGDFKTKYGTDNRDQILVEIFDYIRCANSNDQSKTTSTGGVNPAPFAPLGLVVPSQTSLSSSTVDRGFGRFPTISEVSLVFYYAGARPDPENPPDYSQNPPVHGKILVDENGFPTVSRVRAFLLFSFFDPMEGYAPVATPGQHDPKLGITVTGLGAFKISSYLDGKGTKPGTVINATLFPSGRYTATPGQWTTTVYAAPGDAWGGRSAGGYAGFMHTLIGQNTSWAPHKIARGTGQSSPGFPLPNAALGSNYNQAGWTGMNPDNWIALGGSPKTSTNAFTYQEYYELQTPDPDLYPECEIAFRYGGPTASQPYNPALIEGYFSFSGGTINVQTTYGGQTVQNLPLTFPASLPTQNWLMPKGPPVPGGVLTGFPMNDPNFWLTTNALSIPVAMSTYYWQDDGAFYAAEERGGAALGPYTYQTRLEASWSFASRLAWALQPSYTPYQNSSSTPVNYYTNRWRQIVQPGDTIRSLIYCKTPKPVAVTNSGDLRLAALNPQGSDYLPHPEYFEVFSRACLLRLPDGTRYFPAGAKASAGAYPPASPVTADTSFGNHIALSGKSPTGGPVRIPDNRAFGNLPYTSRNAADGGVNGVVRTDNLPGDFDTGVGDFPDGAFANKPDEGSLLYAYQDKNNGTWIYPTPYFGTWNYEPRGNTYPSPNRQMISPAMFGSLPSRAATGEGWETLCFCPNPAGTGHRGDSVAPYDHLLLDLFQMPVVDPYPMSEPFATAGKVNLNYQIAPFGYITRSTALRGALCALRVTTLSGQNTGSWNDDYMTYKSGQLDANGVPINDPVTGIPQAVTTPYRKRVNRDETIKSFDSFFASGVSNPNTGFFKSASQICEMYLYPSDAQFGVTDMPTYWSNYGLTGDNLREKPYVDLYARITAKSNTYTVHLRVQALRQIPRTSAAGYATWNEGQDAVVGEYRGWSTIERYLDPSDRHLDPNNAITVANHDGVNPDTTSLEGLYRFRTVVNKKFSP